MAEQTYRSPDFYEREVDLSAPQQGSAVGTPAGVIGTANKGPAFVPVTVANYDEFVTVFGGTDPNRMGPYAANVWLNNRSALTYLRVLGAGANTTAAQIASTQVTGRVTSAGFRITGSAVGAPDGYGRLAGAVQFIAATHTLQTNEALGFPVFTENNSRSAASKIDLIRGVVFTPYTARLLVLSGNETAVGKFGGGSTVVDSATVVSNKIKLVISSTLGSTFATTDGYSGLRILTASMNPTDSDYFGKVLNTDPTKFVSEQNYLYLDFAVDDELATAATVAVLSGSQNMSANSGEPSTYFVGAFGAYDTRFKTPTSPWFITQPFGSTEYDLFKFEAIDDGEYANELYKISITNLKMSEDEANPYGTFNVSIRDWNDNDLNPTVLEQFVNCSLDPNSENYVARMVGDRKVFYNFDATIDSERRVVATGKYPNSSKYVRIVMNDAVDRGQVPVKSLPFGFRGVEVLKTNDSLTDAPDGHVRLSGVVAEAVSSLTGSIVPAIPFRFKLTRGEVDSTPAFVGQAGNSEMVNSAYHWGVKFERNTLPLNPNLSTEKNKLVSSLTKFMGIRELDVLVTGSGADTLNNNKFTLAKVAFPNGSVADLTSSLTDHIKDTCYIRNGVINPTNYTIVDPTSSGARITFASLAAQTSSITFNKFQQYAKFTTFLAGGFDGLNILDRSSWLMNDKSVSFDASGSAESTYVPAGFAANQNGTGQSNNSVVSYQTAVDIMTDGMISSVNVLCLPGIDEPFVTDYAAAAVKEYGLALYVMDIPSYDDSGLRLYSDSTTRPDVDKTASALASRAYDNNYVATYWPSVYITDSANKRRVKAPASIAAVGALGFNDKVSYPWYAPAGFNRASLDFVSNVVVRLNVSDRNTLQDQKINPIATFPKTGFVIYGQKTLQMAKSSLDRVNVRRMLLEVKRVIIDEANALMFEQNTPETRQKFVANANLRLALIQTNSGIDQFKVIANETNNTAEDVNANRMNGKVIVVPTRTFETIAIDFIIMPSGVEFQ